MSDEDWKGWYQDDKPSPSAGGPRYEPRSASGSGSGSGYSGGAGYDATHGMTAPADGGRGWPSQPPPVSAPRRPREPYRGEPYPGGLGGGGRRWRFWGQPGRRGRRIALIAGIVVLILIVVAVSSYFWADGKLNKSVTLPATTATSAGTNWLIVGSDSRQGLSRTQRDALHVGTSGSSASDSLMLLHMGGPKPVLISIPRDSYVPIPGYGENKINASLAFGGPTLLIKTVENATGLRIDHYMGIGFGGLVSVVNTVGGVRVCLPQAIQDSYSGVNLSKGCHNLNGTQALAFVRDRHSFATSDLQRIQDQRAFLKALLSKATSPGVYLNPFTAYPFASTAAGSIAVDKGTSLYDLIQAGLALRGAQTGTVPIANAALPTNAGEAVEWNRTEALQLFGALQDNKAVPAGLLSGTSVG
jgi:LCP family protein required for cell wall assembly